MTITKSEIRPGAYFDSVLLMLLQRGLSELPGVEDAGVVMATPANLALLDESNLLTKDGEAGKPDDLLIVVRAKDEKSATEALAEFDSLIKKRKSNVASDFYPKSLVMANKQLPEANWVLISVPGRYAAEVADQALDIGKNVFLYSDNVSIEEEIDLKSKAQKLGLLVMGPDCGTAIINGIGLGFANHVQKGSIGVVGASGTGIQAVTSHVSNLGAGISQAIGTGGRDLKSEIMGITVLQGLEILRQDMDTKVIVLVSKPPAPEIATKILSAAQANDKPVVINFIGHPSASQKIDNLYFVSSLEEAAEKAVSLTKNNDSQKVREKITLPKPTGYLRGLFSGGTLAYEALLSLQSFLSPIYSNVAISKDQNLEDPLESKDHTIIDLGEDVFTVGRLHPMMDNDLRLRRMKKEVEDPEVGVILLDVVLGEGSHPNPAKEISAAILETKILRPELVFVVLVIGTENDPQDKENQIKELEKTGAFVFTSSNNTIEFLNQMYQESNDKISPSIKIEDFLAPFVAINIGLESFYHSIVSQEAKAIHVEWRPPAGGNEKLMSILDKMRN